MGNACLISHAIKSDFYLGKWARIIINARKRKKKEKSARLESS
jgi:hypothetical protein